MTTSAIFKTCPQLACDKVMIKLKICPLYLGYVVDKKWCPCLDSGVWYIMKWRLLPQVGLKMLKYKTGDSFCRKIPPNMATHVLILERKITKFLLDLISYTEFTDHLWNQNVHFRLSQHEQLFKRRKWKRNRKLFSCQETFKRTPKIKIVEFAK